jgi:DNA polymerase III alpha subunit
VFRLEHRHGTAEVLLWPEAFDRYQGAVQEEQLVMVCGQLKVDEDVRFIASEVYPMARVPELFTRCFRLGLDADEVTDERLARLREILYGHPGVNPVVFVVRFATGERVCVSTDAAHHVKPDQELLRALEDVLEPSRIELVVHPSPTLKPPPHRNTRRRTPVGSAN